MSYFHVKICASCFCGSKSRQTPKKAHVKKGHMTLGAGAFHPSSFLCLFSSSWMHPWLETEKNREFWLGHLLKLTIVYLQNLLGHLAYFRVKLTEHPRTMVGILQHWNIPVALSRSWVIDNPSERLLATLTLIKQTVCKPYNWPKCHKPHNQESASSAQATSNLLVAPWKLFVVCGLSSLWSCQALMPSLCWGTVPEGFLFQPFLAQPQLAIK